MPRALVALRTGKPHTPPTRQPLVSATPPPGLSAEAADFWGRVAPDLIATGVVATPGDVESFAECCEVHAAITRVRRDILAEGDTIDGSRGAPVRHPGYLVLGQMLPLYLGFAGQFGLTPSARAKLERNEKPREDTDDLLDSGTG